MSKIFQIAGKTRIYNTDGTGRDTYIGFNNGGNTQAYHPTKSFRQGHFAQTAYNSSFPKQ
jgi:hypothetical protein